MAQYRTDTDQLDPSMSQRFEVIMLADKDGNVIGGTNKIPVDIGSSSVSITGPVTVSNEVEIKNDIGNPVPVNGTISAVGLQVITTASFTRPADTTAYAAQDVVSNSTSVPSVLTFSNAARVNGGTGLILSARHLKNSTTTTGATYRLHLYTAAPSAINDNNPFTLLYANRAIRIGFIDFNHQTGGTGSDSTNALTTFVNLPFVCDAVSTSLFGILTVTSAYTPTSGEQHFIELQIARN